MKVLAAQGIVWWPSKEMRFEAREMSFCIVGPGYIRNDMCTETCKKQLEVFRLMVIIFGYNNPTHNP